MANLKLKNPSGGSLSLVSADGASDLTVTFPAATGTAMVSGNMPAFSAIKNATQSALSGGTWTKIVFQAEEFDTASTYDTSTSVFTPNVAGYYQVNAGVSPASFSGNYFLASLYKNNNLFKNGCNFSPNSAAGATSTVSALIYMNGTTDYLEVYAIAGGTPIILNNGNNDNYFQAILVRAA